MIKIFFITILVLLIANISFSQTDNTENDKTIFQIIEENNSTTNNVVINQEYRLKLLIEKHIKVNKKQDGCEGYRLRIFSDKGNNARKKALEAKAKFMKAHLYTNSYLDYVTPNFKIIVGDFRTKSEAEQFRREIEKDFPNAFIIKDIIKFPKL